MNVQNHMPNTAFLLADLAASIREHQDPVDQYLQQREEYEIFNPFQEAGETSSLQMEASLPYAFWERLGVRHVISNIPHSRTASREYWPIAVDKVCHLWNALKNDERIQELKTYINNCPIIEFADYASVDDATGFWEGLFADVIKPLNKRDFEFMFHLGDTARRPVFEVDEILDIIGDYSSHGKVTLVLDDQEAGKLWNTLHGSRNSATSFDAELPDAKEKYQFLFNTMRIDVLLILYSNRALLFSRDGQFEFATRPFNNINMYLQTRYAFNAGLQLGLLLHLDIHHSIVLGQVVSGACQAQTSIPTSRELLAYIDELSASPTTSSITHRASCLYSG